MEEQWQADRALLRSWLHTQPGLTHQALADHIGRSVSWVKKWRQRLASADPADSHVLCSHSRARHQRPPATSQQIVERILHIRDHPPANLRRTPGPKAILYYLATDPDLVHGPEPLPRSTRTIWRILTQHGRIAPRPSPAHTPIERAAPLTVWQLDFKDASSVAVDADGKRQHVVEILNTVDTGTSVLLDTPVRDDFTAETTLPAVVPALRTYGLPDQVTFDRDPRFVGSMTRRDFPSPFMRFWLCLGVAVDVCPPHRPDKNAYVERYHRTLGEECLNVHRPATLAEVVTVTAAFREHYNFERPNQAVSCGNRPPRQAFPSLPPRPPVPAVVDPDRWVETIAGRRYVRKVRRDGSVTVDDAPYYIGQAWRGHYVALEVDGATREFVVYEGAQMLKRLPMKGLQQQPLTFDAFLKMLGEEAHRVQRRRTLGERRARRR